MKHVSRIVYLLSLKFSLPFLSSLYYQLLIIFNLYHAWSKNGSRLRLCLLLGEEFLTVFFWWNGAMANQLNKNNHQSANCECISLWAEFLIRHSELIAKKRVEKEVKEIHKISTFFFIIINFYEAGFYVTFSTTKGGIEVFLMRLDLLKKSNTLNFIWNVPFSLEHYNSFQLCFHILFIFDIATHKPKTFLSFVNHN